MERSNAEASDLSAVEAVTTHEDLVKLLAAEFARADTSLRELEARADKLGGVRLPRATCADMLAGRRFPKKAVMLAFLRACRVPEQQLPAWERAWERVRIARLPVATLTRQEQTADPAAAPAGQGQSAQPHQRWTPAPAVVIVLTTLALAVGIVFWDRPRTLTDDGRAFGPGGSSRFTVRVDPANTGVRLTRLLDANVAKQRASITVNGAPAGEWKPLTGGSGWLYQSVDLPPHLTAGRSSLVIVNTFVSSYWDFNEFLYIVWQRIDGEWTTADTVDVGPDHTDSETAHDYHITGETFQGPRTFPRPEPEEINP
ncbi:hypothetical protein GCM10010116_11490 [Microbispora rosea subsp. aerata]|nr:hypothetical protein [Microbispora rosea]GGO05852.1 hypothetical protein GCM10010116_11490 [Microbispora rosea subsp. aerata]GIH55242.1 hypothetical protein Mro02_21560 [Microbispora rosea subsp. aerata]GLJ82692.1 hypothetical protein GCM10017588_14170 [Microbispora rosea subsp. aerata]